MRSLAPCLFATSLLITAVSCGENFALFSDGTTTATGGEGGTTTTGGGGTGGGGTGGGTTGGAGGVECSVPEDCPAPGAECVEPTCVGGVCGVANSPQGTPCGAGQVCDGNGACLGENGTACTNGGDCSSGHCVDDLCCDGPCGGTCEACDVSGSEGSCTAVPPATDPDGECSPGECDGSGACAAGGHIWSQRFGNSAAQFSLRMAVDGAGNSVITGYFQGSIDFGGGALTSAGGNDVFVAKFDGAGNHQWSKRFGDSTFQSGWGVAFDTGGNVLLTGYFYGTITFGPNAPIHTSSGQADIFVAKLDPNGNLLWSKSFVGLANSSEWCRTITADGNDDVYIGGWFNNTIDFGGGPLTSTGGSDAYIAKFTSNGTYSGSAHYGSAENQQLYGLATDSANNLLVTGSFSGTIDFGSGTNALTSAGGSDLFIAKIGPTGTALWSQGFGDGAQQVGYSVATDPDANVVISGYFLGNVDFGGGTLQGAGGTDAVVAKFDGAGNHLWSKALGNSSSQLAQGVATDGGGNVIVTGQSTGQIDFGGGPLGSGTSPEAFLVKLSAGGTHLWSQLFDGSSIQAGYGVGTDSTGYVYMTGYFGDSINLGGGPLMSQGGYDAFLAKFSP